MTDPLTNPLWKPTDLGFPIPNSPHAASVCLPTWDDNIQYEEGNPRVLNAMQTGYPRFVFHPFCEQLFDECRQQFADDQEDCLVFPSAQSAQQFQHFLKEQTLEEQSPEEQKTTARIEPFCDEKLFAAIFPKSARNTAKLAWQHYGNGISSRQAESHFNEKNSTQSSLANHECPKQTLKNRIAELTNANPDDVYLFPNGMNAIATVHNAMRQIFPERHSAQFGFPYVDTLKLLEKIGPGAQFFPHGNRNDLAELTQQIQAEPFAGVYAEFPSNPLLISPNIVQLANICHQHNSPLIVDETIAGFANVNLLPTVDVLCTSLTKFFSGEGDVTAGSVVLNANGPFYTEIKAAMQTEFDDIFWIDDAVVLEKNSRDYTTRIAKINETAAQIADFFAGRNEVETVAYPKYTTQENYDQFRKPTGGYSGLISLQLKDAPNTAPQFYDALRLCKGPNLGTNFTLVCPYTILAHYNELDFVETCGVSRWLIRISIGLEETDDLIARFTNAFEHNT